MIIAKAEPTKEEVAEYLNESFDTAQEDASAWAEIIRSTDTTLLLDLDTGTQQDQYRYTLPHVSRAYKGLKESARWASKSGKGLHIVLSLAEPMTVPERLLLQCSLGSDPKREMLGLRLFRAGVENPIMLFKPK